MILGTEVNEFVTNRQQSKIHYLSQENKYLQEYICDLENAVRLNKQAMTIAMEGFSKKSNYQDSTMSFPSSYQNPQVDNLIKYINEENGKLLEALSKQQKLSSQLQTKLLLQEQIGEEQQNYYKDLIADLEYKLIELKRNIHDKEYAIQELERMKPIQEKEGQLVKIIEIVTPSEQNLKLHEEIENLRQILNKVSTEAQQIQDTCIQLKEVNYNLKREIFKMRIILRSQVNYQIMKDFVFNEFLEKDDQFIELQREIQNHRGKLEQLHQEMYGATSLGYGFSPEPQQLKYLSKNERMIYQEKLHKMEMMVKGFKELFEKEKNNYSQTAKLYNELLRKYDQIIDTNELLIKSNQLKDQKVQNILAELIFYKKQSSQLMEQLRSRKPYTQSITLNQEQDIAVGVFSPRFNIQDKQATQNSYFSNKRTKISEEKIVLTTEDEQLSQKQLTQFQEKEQEQSELQQQGKQNKFLLKKPNLQVLIEDPNDHIPLQQQHCLTTRAATQKKDHPQSQYYDMSKEECVNFLISMSQDFFSNFDVDNVSKKQLMKRMNEEEQPNNRKLKRSYSNPFTYFSQEMQNQVYFQKAPKNSIIAITKNEIETLLAEIQEKKRLNEQNKGDPFQIDISNIDIRKNPQNKMNKQVMIDGDASFISNIDQQD